MGETLLLLQPGLSVTERQRSLDAVRAHGTVTATMGPCLCVVQVGSARPGALLHLPGVQAVIGRDGVAALPASLSEAERLFVGGWLAQGRKDAPRPGAGQDWDASGFTPPDAP